VDEFKADKARRAARAHALEIGGVDPEVGIAPLERSVQERLHPRVDIGAEPADLALRDAAHPGRPYQAVNRAGRGPLDVGRLDHRDEGPLPGPARVEEAGEIASLPELGDAQVDRACPRLPGAIAIAVALHHSFAALRAPGSAGDRLHLHLHQPLRGEADHLAEEVRIGGLLDQALQVHHLVGHRDVSGIALVLQPRSCLQNPMTTARPPASASAA